MLDIIDYRNLRYQGETKNDRPHGLGIIIDYTHLFCLALWKEGKIQGPAFVVFPDSKVFCGRIKQKKLDSLCCFYLQEKIQTYANYSQKVEQQRNFVSVLPFCKLILEVEHRQQKWPRVSSHQRYKSQDGSLQRQLTRIFKTSFNLQQYKSWKDFLMMNFVQEFKGKLDWQQSIQKKYTEYFIGIKHSGLGIKLLVFNQEEDIVRMDGETFIPIEIGMFSKHHVLKGLGKKVTDLHYFKYQSEGDFEFEQQNLIKYQRKHREQKAIHFYLQELKLSIFFKNQFLNIDYLSSLSSVYSKFNVQLVEQTQKIAQIILENPDQSNIVLAQIQQKRHRRKITPQKSQKSLISSEYQTVAKLQPNQDSLNKKQNSVSNSKKSNIVPLTQIQKQIYSSVSKKNNNSTKKYTLENNNKTVPRQNYVNDIPQIKNYQRQASTKIIYQNPSKQNQQQTSATMFNLLAEKPKQNRYKKIFDYDYNKRQPIHKATQSTKKHSPFGNIHLAESQSIINTPNNSQYNDRKAISPLKDVIPDYKREKLARNQTEYKMEIQRNRILYHNPIRSQEQNVKRTFELNDSSQLEQEYQFPINKYDLSGSSSSVEYAADIKDKEQLINFFNKAMQEPYSSLQKQQNINNMLHWTAGNSPTSKKTPGKIRTTHKKQNF